MGIQFNKLLGIQGEFGGKLDFRTLASPIWRHCWYSRYLFEYQQVFIHAVKKDRVKLKLTVEDHPQKSENIKMITEPTSDKDWEIPKIVKTHTLTVRNIGNVDAHIEDAWIICNKGDKHKVLVSDPNYQMMLYEIPRSHSVKLAPKSSTKLNVYLRRGEEAFEARKAEIIDSTGKSWRVNA